MSDSKVIAYLSPAEMVALMSETGMIMVHESVIMQGQPVIHAALKVINAQTGEQLPGGLPFTVVMFKTPREPGYSNIAIGTVVPVAELGIALPRDFYNFANQHYRFARVFPLDERAFVIQMDLFLHDATREYVKFGFGVWGALFSQLLFDLMGKGGQALNSAVEVYAAARTGLAQHFVDTVMETGVAAPEAASEIPANEPETLTTPMELQLEPEPETVESAELPVGSPDRAEATTEVLAEAESDPESEPNLPPKFDAVSYADMTTAVHDVETDKSEDTVEVESRADASADTAAKAELEAPGDAHSDEAGREPQEAPVALPVAPEAATDTKSEAAPLDDEMSGPVAGLTAGIPETV